MSFYCTHSWYSNFRHWCHVPNLAMTTIYLMTCVISIFVWYCNFDSHKYSILIIVGRVLWAHPLFMFSWYIIDLIWITQLITILIRPLLVQNWNLHECHPLLKRRPRLTHDLLSVVEIDILCIFIRIARDMFWPCSGSQVLNVMYYLIGASTLNLWLTIHSYVNNEVLPPKNLTNSHRIMWEMESQCSQISFPTTTWELHLR